MDPQDKDDAIERNYFRKRSSQEVRKNLDGTVQVSMDSEILKSDGPPQIDTAMDTKLSKRSEVERVNCLESSTKSGSLDLANEPTPIYIPTPEEVNDLKSEKRNVDQANDDVVEQVIPDGWHKIHVTPDAMEAMEAFSHSNENIESGSLDLGNAPSSKHYIILAEEEHNSDDIEAGVVEQVVPFAFVNSDEIALIDETDSHEQFGSPTRINSTDHNDSANLPEN